MQIELPISKSIANRLLILQAIHGDGLLTVSDCYSLPDDVQLLYQALRLVHIKSSPRRSQGVDCERNVVENNVVGVVDLYKIERDWSSAAFWYEYVALHGGEITLPGLYRDSLQGDKVVADIFTRLGVQTTYTAEGITIVSTGVADLQRSDLQGIDVRSTAQRSAEEILLQDFSACPDLYPAVALTCERLGIELHATGTDSLPLKESDRLRAVREHRTDHDHRMAMALLIAGYEVDDTICISKSYPQFIEQWNNVIRSHA